MSIYIKLFRQKRRQVRLEGNTIYTDIACQLELEEESLIYERALLYYECDKSGSLLQISTADMRISIEKHIKL